AAHLRRLLESAHEGRTVVAQSGKGAEGHLVYGRRYQGADQLDYAPCDAEMPQDDGAEEGADKKIECLLADTADHLAGRDMEAETRGFAQIRQREAEARPPADSREDRDVGDDGGDELLSDEAPGAEIEDCHRDAGGRPGEPAAEIADRDGPEAQLAAEQRDRNHAGAVERQHEGKPRQKVRQPRLAQPVGEKAGAAIAGRGHGKREQDRAPEGGIEMRRLQPGTQHDGVGKTVRHNEVEADDEGAGEGDGTEVGRIEQPGQHDKGAQRQCRNADTFTGRPQQPLYAACFQAFRHYAGPVFLSGETHPSTRLTETDQTHTPSAIILWMPPT